MGLEPRSPTEVYACVCQRSNINFEFFLTANWRSIVNKDLSRMRITWEEAEVAAQNRSEWRQSVAQCIRLDAG